MATEGPRTAATRQQRGPAAVWTGLLLLYALLAVLTQLPVWRSPATVVAGIGHDQEQTIWFLGWLPHALAHGENPFLTDAINAPAGVNLLWNTAIPLPSLLLWPVTATAGAVVSYNVTLTAALALSAWCACVAIHRWVRSIAAAAVGGLVYGFSPFMSAHERGHANIVLSAVMVPIALLVLDELLVRQRRRAWVTGAMVAAVAVAQFLIFEEYLATTLVFAAVVGLLLVVFGRRSVRAHARYVLRALAVALPVTAAVLAYPLWVQFAGPDVVHGQIQTVGAFVVDPRNFLVPTSVQWLAPQPALSIAKQFPGGIPEQGAYLGIPLILIVGAVAARCWRLTVVRVALITAGVAAVCSLGPHLHLGSGTTAIPLPWVVAERVPLLKQALPARLSVFVDLAAAILLAFALQLLMSRRHGVWLAAAAAALVLLTLAPKVPYPSAPRSAPALFSAGNPSVPQGLVYAIPWPRAGETVTMEAQAVSGYRFRLLGGYFTGPASTGQDALIQAADLLVTGGEHPSLDEATRAAVRRTLVSEHVNAVMLMPTSNQAAVAAYLTTLFGAPSVHQDGVVIWTLQ